MSLALARLFAGPPGDRDTTFHLADQLALTSVITFVFGSSIARLSLLDRLGPKSRIWLISATLVQALCTTAAALTIWRNAQPSVTNERSEIVWTGTLAFVCVAFMSASVGLQGIMAKRLGTQFTTTGECSSISCTFQSSVSVSFRSRINNDVVRAYG